jgi:hypothetical protein
MNLDRVYIFLEGGKSFAIFLLDEEKEKKQRLQLAHKSLLKLLAKLAKPELLLLRYADRLADYKKITRKCGVKKLLFASCWHCGKLVLKDIILAELRYLVRS